MKEHKIKDNSLAGTFTCEQCAYKKNCGMRRETYRGGELHAKTVRCSEWKRA